jgi:hypothetical protein
VFKVLNVIEPELVRPVKPLNVPVIVELPVIDAPPALTVNPPVVMVAPPADTVRPLPIVAPFVIVRPLNVGDAPVPIF